MSLDLRCFIGLGFTIRLFALVLAYLRLNRPPRLHLHPSPASRVQRLERWDSVRRLRQPG